MDSLTHIALGACIGEAFFEKGFGKKAMLWGALAQSIPDADFIASFWLTPAENLLAHRGFTHSLLFVLLLAPAMALVAEKLHRPHNISFKKWTAFFLTEILVHLALDGLNSYGTGWLEPFSHRRFSLNVLYVADPFFSIAPGLALIALLLLGRYNPARVSWWKAGILIPSFYLLYCFANKIKISNELQASIARQHIPADRYFSTPAPLQNWLWYVVSGNDSGYYIGFLSLFDKQRETDFHYFPRRDSLLLSLGAHMDIGLLKRFSQGYYTVEAWGDTLVFNDLRFGQIIGWQDRQQKFVFHYYLNHAGSNDLVLQRGRIAGWNPEVIRNYFRRIRGN